MGWNGFILSYKLSSVKEPQSMSDVAMKELVEGEDFGEQIADDFLKVWNV